jgi:hypothetical protein
MINITLEQIDKLNEIIDAIDNKDSTSAKDKAIFWRDNLQDEIDKAESDVDVQLQLDMESQWGK